MEIIEKSIIGKSTDQSLCEDGLFISEDFIAVIDGVTAKSPEFFNGKTGGRAAMESILKTLEKVDKNITKNDLFKILNEHISELYNISPDGRASACAIIYSKAYNEIWCCGDCQCLINNTLYLNEKEIDSIFSKARALVLEIALLQGKTEDELLENDIGREFIKPILETQHLFENSNNQFAYEVLNGKNLRYDLIKTYKVNTGDTVVLASDGYPVLKNTLEESENELKKVIKENPLCNKAYLSTKGVKKGNMSFDDRTYIKFIV